MHSAGLDEKYRKANTATMRENYGDQREMCYAQRREWEWQVCELHLE